MIFPSADAIERNVGSRYSLVILAAKRAKQIKEGAPVLIDTDSTNPLTIAMEEIAAGKVTILAGSDAMVPTGKTTAPDAAPSESLPAPTLAGRSANDGLPADDVDGTDDANIAGEATLEAAA